MLKINDLHVHYGGIHAVKGVTLSIPRGSVVTLIGANGAGKSSIIRSIAGLVKGAKGEVLLTRHEGDQPVQLLGQPAENMVRSGIALSPEGRRILPHLSVAENLQLGAWCREDKEGIAKDIEMVYDLFPRLRERSWQKGGTLSGGEQQMLAISRAIMSHPKLLMLDEPSMGLSPLLVDQVFEIIKDINKDGTTILLVEQNAGKSLAISDQAYVLENGSIVLSGTGKELAESEMVRKAYLGG